MSLTDDVLKELGKVRDVLHAIAGRIHWSSETELNEFHALIDEIAPSSVPAPDAATTAAPATDTPVNPTPAAPATDTPVDPLAGVSVEDLEAELAKRQG